MRTFCYVASPYASVRRALEPMDWVSIVRGYALKGARHAKMMGFIPISPILCFDGVYNEESERLEVLADGLEFLRNCQSIIEIKTPYSNNSEGMKKELALAKSLGLSHYCIEIK
ncbi:hypothetical protein BKH41_02715 [Helicobacter sp. 12S02232-10]|uniref:DUF7768 domain-containing protein n=1 Tax=Helicobacter sp. 12S02232-10 TaxID=1476197 RepID=UPI000BA6B927|nr:hypothetical protein [Helicobacter sp. 12S02232-10]PAF49594.1 hypothetical protein BKH41_02715 [Helicobacter sp. 12S02232-10]